MRGKPSDWSEFFSRARTLVEAFEKHLETGWSHNLWEKKLNELRLDLLFLITTKDGNVKVLSDHDYRLMHAGEIVMENLEKIYNTILVATLKNHSR